MVNVTGRGTIFAIAVTVATLSVLGSVAPRAEAFSVNYLCFFDLRSARLSDRCLLVIDHFYQAWRNKPPGQHVEIDGYAQDYGHAVSDLRLSMMRARAVSAELEKLGVERDSLRRKGYGNTVPLVQSATPDPQNRRVALIFKPQ